MNDQPQLKPSALLRESFLYAKERFPEILKSQILYFVLLLPISVAMAYALVEMMGHINQINTMQAVEEAVQKSGGKPDMTLINEEWVKTIPSFVKTALISTLSYFFGKSFLHNLYDGLSKGAAFPRYTIFPVAQNVWRLMMLDLKISWVVMIRLIILIIIMGIFMAVINSFGAAFKIQIPIFLNVLPIIVMSVYMVYVMFGRCVILMSAPPTVYEHSPISLMKHFYPATKGYRWKIFISKMGASMPILIVNYILSHFFNGKETLLDLQATLIQNTLVTVLYAGWMIWDVYLNVLLWQHLAPRVRELATPPAA